MLTSEHILLESDFREVPALSNARKTHGEVRVRSRFRRRTLQLEIIDYYYLSVRSRSGSVALEYVLDLRFVAAPPRFTRRVAWRWITASLVLLGVATGIAGGIVSSATPWWRHGWLPLFATAAAVCAGATLIAAWRTTETVRLFSTHGVAKLLEFTGGVGTLRVLRTFMARLAAHIRLAAAARRPTRAEHLRDEMREHVRLKEVGVLSGEEYEASKGRILAQHTPPAAARGRPSRP